MAIQRLDIYYLIHHVAGVTTIFEVSDEDLAGDPSYFGYVNEDGGWIIQQRNAASGTYRYYKGSSGYTSAWTGRAGLSYTYWNLI